MFIEEDKKQKINPFIKVYDNQILSLKNIDGDKEWWIGNQKLDIEVKYDICTCDRIYSLFIKK